MKKFQIGLIGSAGKEEYLKSKKPANTIYELAYMLGKEIGKRNMILVTGGKGGVMREAARGAKEYNCVTVSVVKGKKRNTSNEYTDIEVVTGMEGGGDVLPLVLMCDAFIAVGGGAGTLSEITTAYRNKKPVIALTICKGWSKKLANSFLDEREIIKIHEAKSVSEAINKLVHLLNKS